MGRCLTILSLLGLSTVSALAQPAPEEYFKLRSSSAQSEMEVPGTCKPVVDTIARFAPALGDTNASVRPDSVHITFLNEKRTITLRTYSQPATCTAKLTCDNPAGGGAEWMCREIERMVQDHQRKSPPQR